MSMATAFSALLVLHRSATFLSALDNPGSAFDFLRHVSTNAGSRGGQAPGRSVRLALSAATDSALQAPGARCPGSIQDQPERGVPLRRLLPTASA